MKKLFCKIFGHKIQWKYNKGFDASWHYCDRCGIGHWNDRAACEWKECASLNLAETLKRLLMRLEK